MPPEPDARRPAVAGRLGHVYWIGGGSGAGKSTLARRLAALHGLEVYPTDDVMPDHARRCPPEQAPELARFVAMDLDGRWVNRSPRTMFETFHWFRGEGFGLIVEDLLGLSGGGRRVVAEGIRLLPRLVEPLLAGPGHAVWLLPTPRFREAVFDGRGGASWAFLGRTGDPERALRNLLERDRMFTEELRRDVERLGLPAVEVDTTMTEDDLLGQVTDLLG